MSYGTIPLSTAGPKLRMKHYPMGQSKTFWQFPPFMTNLPILSYWHYPIFFTAWYKYVICKKWVFVSRDVIPVTSLQTWIPHLPLSNWLAKGITTVSQFYSGEYVLPFGTLSSMYNLPKSLFYQYLQIHHALQAISWPLKSTIPLFKPIYLAPPVLKVACPKFITCYWTFPSIPYRNIISDGSKSCLHTFLPLNGKGPPQLH